MTIKDIPAGQKLRCNPYGGKVLPGDTMTTAMGLFGNLYQFQLAEGPSVYLVGSLEVVWGIDSYLLL